MEDPSYFSWEECVEKESGEDPETTLYCRCPLSLAVRLRTLAFERSKGKRRCVTQNDLLIEAVERFLTSEMI